MIHTVVFTSLSS